MRDMRHTCTFGGPGITEATVTVGPRDNLAWLAPSRHYCRPSKDEGNTIKGSAHAVSALALFCAKCPRRSISLQMICQRPAVGGRGDRKTMLDTVVMLPWSSRRAQHGPPSPRKGPVCRHSAKICAASPHQCCHTGGTSAGHTHTHTDTRNTLQCTRLNVLKQGNVASEVAMQAKVNRQTCSHPALHEDIALTTQLNIAQALLPPRGYQ